MMEPENENRNCFKFLLLNSCTSFTVKYTPLFYIQYIYFNGYSFELNSRISYTLGWLLFSFTMVIYAVKKPRIHRVEVVMYCGWGFVNEC